MLETTGRFRLKSFFSSSHEAFFEHELTAPRIMTVRDKTRKSSLVIMTKGILWFRAYRDINNCLQILFANGRVLIPLSQQTLVLIQESISIYKE